MAGRGFRGDWVDLAAFLMMLTGALDFFEGLIGIVRGTYYTFDPQEILVVDLTAWGWILLLWGSFVALTGCALLLRSTLARWVGLVITSVNVIVQLAFGGGNHYPLWGLVGIALSVVILYALTVRWDGAEGHP